MTDAPESFENAALTVHQVRTWAAIEGVGSDTPSVLASAAFTRCADEIERLTDEIERLRHQEVHHWLSDGGYSNPTIACGIDINAVAHRDAAFATCQTCRDAAFVRGVLPS